MSVRPAWKLPEPELMVTRFKSTQMKIQLRKMDRSMKQVTQLLKSPTRSPKKRPEKTNKELSHKAENVTSLKEPNKLKRKLCVKKVVLKPKYNSEVVAATNKRKLTVPQKGRKSPVSLKATSPSPTMSPSPASSELSMSDAVRLMDVTMQLSDEDLMEILTCPSPVWWEDPPDEGYIEEPICRQPGPSKALNNSNENKIINSNKTNTSASHNNLIDFEQQINEFKIKFNKTDKKFEQKKTKLENILGNIKNKANTRDDKVISNNTDAAKEIKSRTISSSSEGDMFSAMSLNEEDILKDLESIEIPIADTKSDNKKTEYICSPCVNERSNILAEPNSDVDLNMVPTTLPPLKRKPNFKDTKKESPELEKLSPAVQLSDIDSISGSNIKFISDDDSQNSDETCTLNQNNMFSSKTEINNKTTPPITHADISDTNNRLTNDSTEYISVYKIVSDIPENCENTADSVEDTKCLTVQSNRKLNYFYKKCKNNKRFRKGSGLLTFSGSNNNEIKKYLEKEISDKKKTDLDECSGIKDCEYCVLQAETGNKDISCDKCKLAPINTCDLCDSRANTKEFIPKHVSRCKDVDRISWSHNYVLNHT